MSQKVVDWLALCPHQDEFEIMTIWKPMKFCLSSAL